MMLDAGCWILDIQLPASSIEYPATNISIYVLAQHTSDLLPRDSRSASRSADVVHDRGVADAAVSALGHERIPAFAVLAEKRAESIGRWPRGIERDHRAAAADRRRSLCPEPVCR